jgi:hypothetical protein
VTDLERVQELVTRSRAATRVSGSLAVLTPPVLFEAIARARADLRLVMREPRTGGVVVVVFNQGEPTMVFSPGDGHSVGELLLAAGHIDHETLTTWVQERPQSPASLARQVRERTNLEPGEVQRLLDFQARVRLLDALVWREGFFELQDYRGGNETAFRLELPNLASLVVRAEARGAALPRLLARLPATPVNTVARRRRGGQRPTEGLEAGIFAALDEPLLIPQLVARLLVDDDLIIDAALRLADRKVLVLQPRVELTAEEGDEIAVDPRLATLLRQVLDRYRGAGAEHGVAALWVVLVSASPNDAADLVTHLGGEPGEVMLPGDTVARTGFASRTLRLATDARLRLLALRPDNLSRGALEGVLALRCRGAGAGRQLGRRSAAVAGVGAAGRGVGRRLAAAHARPRPRQRAAPVGRIPGRGARDPGMARARGGLDRRAAARGDARRGELPRRAAPLSRFG